MILIKGSLLNNSSLVATLATVGNPFYKQNSKMAAKWRHTIWMILCILKTVSVIHVIRGFRGHIIHFYWWYVHLTSLEPIFCFLNKMPKIRPDSLPPPPKKKTKKLHFHRTRWLLIQQNQQNPHIWDHSDAFCSHKVCKKSYKRPKCALIAYRSRHISHGFLSPSFGSQWWIQSLKIIFRFDEYCARGLSKFNSCTEVLTSVYIINNVALKGS